MENILIRIIEKLFIIYFISYFIFDLFLFIIFLFTFRSEKKKNLNYINSGILPYKKITIIVPAYNEEVTIIQCIEMLKELNYPDFEIIVVNDGSKDETLSKVLSRYKMYAVEKKYYQTIRSMEVLNIYASKDKKLLLVDKQNGGKADSINTGINLSTGEFICTVDADSILDKDALIKVVIPLIIDQKVFVSGGQLAVSNDMVLENNKIVSTKMPDNIWVLWQIAEYIKSFMVSRTALSKINSLLIMSGAFSVFRRKDLIAVKGFLTRINKLEFIDDPVQMIHSTVCEDMEIVIRLWDHYHRNKKRGKAVFMPLPICWTEVPETPGSLYKQRVRWHLGLTECLFIHRKLMFDPRYKETGLIAMPYYFFYEMLSPLIKVLAIIFIISVSFFGLLNIKWIIIMLIVITLTAAIVTGIITVMIEQWSGKKALQNREALRYRTTFDWIKLLGASVVGDFSYSFFRVFAQLKGLYNFIKEDAQWNKFERKGLKNIEAEVKISET